ncbi:MAG: type IX secretion system sortase PorU [Bacteroides sp.]|jgi:hypothetical protein|nr:type IX secretion system sortase PorU [Bacteroides sp.]
MIKICSFFLVLLTFPVFLFGQNNAREFRLDWQSPERIQPAPEYFIDLVKFSGAVYGDSLDNIPMFTYRVKNTVPHFRVEFNLQQEAFVPVSMEERRILEEAGFPFSDIELFQGQQQVRKEAFSVVSFFPIRKNPSTGGFEKLVSFILKEETIYDAAISYEPVQEYVSNSVLSSGTWYKICGSETGVYQLTYDDLASLGVAMGGLQKSNIRIFGHGGGMLPEDNSTPRIDDLKELAIFVSGSQSGTFGQNDYILYYNESPNQWTFDPVEKVFNHQLHLYSTENCYFLTTDKGVGKRIASQSSLPETATHTVSTFQDYAYHERELDNLIGSGRVWFGEVFDATLIREFTFDFPGLVLNEPARLKSYVAARSTENSSFLAKAGNGQMTQGVNRIFLANYNGPHANISVDSMWFNPVQGDQIKVTLTYNRPVAGSRGWLNYLALNVTRLLQFTGPQMAFRNVHVMGEGHIAQYNLGNSTNQLKVWDVTDPFEIREQQTGLSGNTLQFRQTASVLREFIAFDGTSFKRPVLKGHVENQNLHAMQASDMIIIVPEFLKGEAQRLADFRSEHDGLSVSVVTTDHVYNEFSSGTADIGAIRNFVKMFYDRGETEAQIPRYLLLFGNGTIDNRDLQGFGGNPIPTFQSENSLQPDRSYMTDDFYGLLDDSEGQDANGSLDIGIGRLPVRTLEEAKTVVDKIIRYDQRIPGMDPEQDNMQNIGVVSNYADWRNLVVLIADDQDNNTHIRDSETLAGIMEDQFPLFNVDKIYLDAYQQVTLAGGARYPDVNQAINERVNQGALLINYIGHGGIMGLAHERIVTFEDIATWNNYYNMPVFMTATCEFSSFDHPDPDDVTAGVRIFMKPDGGAAALFTTTRLAWSGPNLTLNRNFMNVAFELDPQGKYYRLGDLIRLSKVNSSGQLEHWRIRNFVLLGDPSMQMAYPQYQVVTESVADTIKAFQQVTVSGYIADETGNPVPGYNGVVFPSVYDKKMNYTTLGQDSDSQQLDFNIRNALLYKGKARVTDGQFSFSFIVPQDIAYNFGSGRISYYLDNGEKDGNGFFEDFIIGGSLVNYDPDQEGPDIRLFLNDTTFVSGETTNQNPLLLALLFDESGINITGRIGHDIVAILNEETSSPVVLNNFFEADLDDFQRGRVIYPFNGLPEGRHTLSLRAWDVHNNPSTVSIEFIVSRTAALALENLMNYPNPFRDFTQFKFTHNQPFSELDVTIEIFDLSGKLMQTIETTVNSPSYQSPPIPWDGKDQEGRTIGNGIYLYRLILQTPDGNVSTMTQKLVVLR